MHIIADTRERNVLRHDKEFADIDIKVEQINVGDYAIFDEDKMIAIIERKSLEDYAASLKDGRHQNKQKLIDIRNQTNCKIIYIIEGKQTTNPNKLYNRMPYRYIESSIFHLIMRDDIFIIRSENTLDTAKILVRFLKSMKTLKNKSFKSGSNESTTKQNVSLGASEELLHKRQKKSTYEIVRNMWCKFRGISVGTADDYMKKWTILDIINKKDDIKHKINKRVIKSLTNVDENTKIKILSAVPLISLNTAKEIIQVSPSFKTSEELSNIKIGKTKKRLGASKANKILECLNYKTNL